jgi:hypothetical protein
VWVFLKKIKAKFQNHMLMTIVISIWGDQGGMSKLMGMSTFQIFTVLSTPDANPLKDKGSSGWIMQCETET